ncbi:histidine phosphatase family protein [Aurantimonas sp. 22II-16-19i]|uniref:SixA phosphatase family protein n=1 Tax=Aurantimonas sp. 22II-16-19i TaxID=1317114 RepID=UPI0009F7B422|nr:histidine phosphatase family protein [Aurantimonas sp. 22II-16-19i]ORE89692.1 putative phosphohistidine phosphatase SixA [Aurantimonas sp. 22II-16-19i]
MTVAFGRHLLILRHAHSSWARPGQRDHQRPLDARGEEDAARLAQIVARERLPIDAVVCSTATRAVDTLAALLPMLGETPPVSYSDELYALGTEAYYAAAKTGGDAAALLIVGHNPTIEDFTRSLAASGEEEALAAIAAGFPTAALAILGLERPFGEIAPGSGHLCRVIRP